MPHKNVYIRRAVWEKLKEIPHWMVYLNELLEKELGLVSEEAEQK